MPTNYFIESPGEALPVGQFVKTKAGKPTNKLYMVTVSERPAVVVDYLTSFLNKYDTRYTKAEVMGNQNDAEYEQLQKWYMQTSQNNAVYYAAKKAGLSPKKNYLGVYVMDVLPHSSFIHKLKIGDTVTAINGQKFNSNDGMMKYLATQKLGSKVVVTYLRNNKTNNVSGKIIRVPGTKRTGIGIQLIDHSTVSVKPAIKINAGDIGGPSAGLMFSLECYQIYAHRDLTHGMKIAGTGTIDDQGNVGIIGGVDKKVVAADKAGAKVFFAPTQKLPGMKSSETNYAVAKKTAKMLNTKMKIVPVSTFDDALNYLLRNN